MSTVISTDGDGGSKVLLTNEKYSIFPDDADYSNSALFVSTDHLI